MFLAPDSLKTNTKLAQTTAASSNWPKVPDVPKVSNNKHSAELQNAANLISQAVNASSMSNLSNSHIAPTLGNASNNSSNNNNVVPNNMNSVANDLSDINGKISELIGKFILVMSLFCVLSKKSFVWRTAIVSVFKFSVNYFKPSYIK